MQLATLTELKTMLEKEDIDQDELLNLILSGVSSAVQSFLNRGLVKATRTDLYNGGRESYHVYCYPIDASSPPTITVDSIAKEETTDYVVDYEQGIIRFLSVPTQRVPLTVSITYTGGYDLRVTGEDETNIVDVPDDLKMAVLMQAAFYFRNRDNLGVQRIDMVGGNRVLYAELSKLLPGVKKMLINYRRFPEPQ